MKTSIGITVTNETYALMRKRKVPNVTTKKKKKIPHQVIMITKKEEKNKGYTKQPEKK